MVAFRKLFPVLAIGAFLIGTASTASAQTGTGQPLVCDTNAGVPPVVRAEGHTELVGDIVIVCTGGNPSQAFTANFQLFLNTNVTSRLIGGTSEALLMIDEPGAPRVNTDGTPSASTTPFCVAPDVTSFSAPGATVIGGNGSAVPGSQVPGLPVRGLFGTGTAATCNNVAVAPAGSNFPSGVTPGPANQTFQQGTYTVFRGQPANAANGVANAAVVWPGVPIVPPGTTGTRVIRITNVRANAAGVPASASLVPSQIFAFVSISASQSLALNNPQQAVAFVLPGLQFDVRNCAGGGIDSAGTFAQCLSQNRDLFNDPNRSTASGAQLGLRFREGFQTAFKTRIEGDTVAGSGQFRSIPGVVYNTESGFVRPELGNVGIADTATRVAARFTNVPEGVRLFVSTQSVQQLATDNTNVGSNTANAVLVSVQPTSTGIGFSSEQATTTLSCAGLASSPAAEVLLTGTGNTRSGVAVWEVTSANSANIDTLFFYLGVAYAANTPNNLPGLGTSSVTGSFAPFYAANSNAGQASSSLPIPRFIDNARATTDFTINQCITNLLFPFVTNQAGFDTGMAISNTSRDPFSGNANRLQSGTCTLNYYGNVNGTQLTDSRPNTTTNAIGAGEHVAFTLSSGGANGLTGLPGFQGYVIAQCRFQFAHGFAFITDGPIGQARVAEGYLALVMDSAIGTRTGSTSEVLSH
jgi:hypothetical protein